MLVSGDTNLVGFTIVEGLDYGSLYLRVGLWPVAALKRWFDVCL